ncbi:ABC transporter substrate-binding protein (plasmid) [Deinococcus metallilatus]|uniref:Peptide/nickel transport system substrate-binding protein n=1 Tax=Deinococcus metallilatus TaxID=1211322 RepID=A0ABR6MV87_9DEIO|nr:ABC transporter substrate-binding protein [Deinococcus metallilatus]MBB5295830.1 peptide/nickel transport system substrate-binding protein [Deinococcus metallilatus]QBY06744.1 ABC transporter substrate-binding protein [Deinococcus metallilatus]GMA14356.1 ABC transporter substrate-binding protein [Deinococcus metallilatus]
MKTRSALTAALVLGLILTPALPVQAQAAVKKGGTLEAAWTQEPASLDPDVSSAYSSFQILENVLDTLVTLNTRGNIIPSLATSWKTSADGKTWTFTLRPGVKFSNGRAMTAADVVYSLNRLRDPKTGSGNAYHLSGVTSVTAPNAHTVVLTLKEARTNILGDLTSKSTGVFAREGVANKTIATAPIGTGPFRITSYQPGVGVKLARNPYYWQAGLPYLDGIDIRVIPDEGVRRSSLVSGDVDWVMAVPPQDIPTLKKNPKLVVDSVPAFAYWYIGVNTRRKPLDQKPVRQAIAEAINRDQIVQGAMFGQAVVNQGPIPANNAFAQRYSPYTGSLDKARALLAAGRVPQGFETSIMVTTQYPETVRIAQILQAQLAALGIKASIRTLEWAQWLEEEGKGNYDLFVLNWNAMVDPGDYFYAQHRTGQGFNFTGYSNPTLDKLLDAARFSTNDAQRKALYAQINKIVVDDAPYIYLFNPYNVNAYSTAVKGYAARPDQAINFTRTWLNR